MQPLKILIRFQQQIVIGTCVVLSLLSMVLPLAIVPGYVLQRPWTLLLGGFIESNAIFVSLSNQFVVNITVLAIFQRYFAKSWGPSAFTTYFLLISLLTQLATTLLVLFATVLFRDPERLFELQINGLGGFLCGCVVALKQAIPEHKIKVLNVPVMRIKYLPSLIFALHLGLFGLGWIYIAFFMHASGIIISWVYLRYYKFYDGRQGDRSETFSFASFFPDAMMYPALIQPHIETSLHCHIQDSNTAEAATPIA